MYHIIKNTNDDSTLYLTSTNLMDLYASEFGIDELFEEVRKCGGRAKWFEFLNKIQEVYGLDCLAFCGEWKESAEENVESLSNFANKD